MTQSLLSSWQYSFVMEDGYESFLKALNRIKEPPNEAMLKGTAFEHCVNSVLNGIEIPEDHTWYKPVTQLAEYLEGSQQQVSIKKDIIVDGVCFELHGVLDFLKAGIIYDTKFSTHYRLNKYLDSPQHPMYFYLVPEAREFQYLSCDGKFIYKEIYRPEDTTHIEVLLKQFMKYLEVHDLIEIYTSIWNLDTYYASKKKERKNDVLEQLQIQKAGISGEKAGKLSLYHSECNRRNEQIKRQEYAYNLRQTVRHRIDSESIYR